MARRRELGSIASGIIGSFNSRNNDVNGYWGIGKLYLYVQNMESKSIQINLLDKTLSPPSKEFIKLLDDYHSMLLSQFSRRGIPLDWIVSAKITVTFESEYQHKYHFWRSALGKPCICSCEIVDDNGRIHKAVTGNNCLPHNPLREQRSTRV